MRQPDDIDDMPMPDEHPCDGPLGDIHEAALFLSTRGWPDVAMKIAMAHEAIQGYLIAERPTDAVLEAAQRRFTDLRDILLNEPWHAKCTIIPDYMPPFPGENDRPTLQVRYEDGTKYPPYLRYSHGPRQGFFWDIYGDNLMSEALAIVAISQAPAPRNVNPITFHFDLPRSAPVPTTEEK